MPAVYRIKNLITGYIYVGHTQDYEYRIRNHFNRLRTGNHPSQLMQEDYNKHGEKAFVAQVLNDRLGREDAQVIEIETIRDTPCTYNINYSSIARRKRAAKNP
jgi:group I intron endonuclease